MHREAHSPADLAIDVVIANHDYGEFVEAAVESACSQAHPLVNVIVVDDGSTDDSRDRLAAYADRAAIVFKENGGQASAFNAGLAHCGGDIVMFLDADDVLKPHAAGAVAQAFAAEPRAARVQFRLEVIDGDGRPTGVTKPHPHLPLPSGELLYAELGFPFDIPSLPTSGNAFRREALQRIAPVPEAAYPRCGADWYLVHLTSLLGPVVSLERVCGSYRVHGGNAYELREPRLDLAHVHDTIAYATATARALEELADSLGMARPGRILSMAALANRLIARRVDPGPTPDSIRTLLADAVRAARRRSDVRWPMKAILLGWFAATAVAPRPLVVPLAELFLFPERRRRFSRFAGRLQRPAAMSA